ncbi:MAG: RNA polymerase sigma factor [Isosphaerales bacterium]
MPYRSDSEREIGEAVHAVRAGNAQAYATIVERFQGPVTTLCAAIVRNRQAAEELAQDVFVRAYQRLDMFDIRQPMKPWLVKIAYHLAQQRWRERARETARRKVAATMREQNRNESGPAERLFVDERSEMLWQAVYALPMAQRTAVVLYYREGLTVKEVAKAMGVSPGTIKTHLFRARAQIQISMRAKGFDDGDIP